MLNAVISISSNAIIANPFNSQNYLFVGELFRSLDAQGVSGASAQATALYDNAVTYEKYNPLIRVLQARLAIQQEDTDTARAKLEEAVALKPNYTEAVFLLSQLLIEEGGSDEAIKQLEARAQLAPVEPIVFFQLGFLKYAEKDYAGAIPALENAVVLIPEYSNALYFLGLSYYYEDMDAQAIAAFERIIYLNPDSDEAKNVLANMREGRAPFGAVSQAPENQDELPISEEDDADEE
jgi:tetratricopeptide (TPR) repeat protein